MAWCLCGAKPLSEPMLTQFTDIYVAQIGDELPLPMFLRALIQYKYVVLPVKEIPL